MPHIVEEIKNRIKKAGKGNDILIVELGGTVGDIEGLPFLEAIRELINELGTHKALNIHVTLVPYIKAADELKTKPTQHSVQELRRIGITPDMIIARCEIPLPKSVKEKIARSCGVKISAVIEARDAETIYKVPLNFLRENILYSISKQFRLKELKPNMDEWDILVKKIIAPKDEVTIAFVGKYINLKESYKSLTEALIHAGAHLDTKVNIKWTDSELIESEGSERLLKEIDGILVAGGFGERGIEGKIEAIKYARTNKIPYLGICLGMQLCIIEFCRNVLKIKDANSIEFDKKTKNPVIYLIDEFIDQYGKKQLRTFSSPLGGTMRLGEYACKVKKHTKLHKAYSENEIIYERHRHRYEANPKYRELFEKKGLIVSGESQEGLIEAVELRDHPWFIGVQFHPEFTSHLTKPNPLVKAFIENSMS